MHAYEKYRKIALVLTATLGGALGFAASTRRATATTCVPCHQPGVFRLNLESVTSSDPKIDNTAAWAAKGTFTEAKTELLFQAAGTPSNVVRYVRARR